MARKQSKGGEVGAFGWTLLGFLAGVAATLAIQLIMVGRNRAEEPDDSAHAAPVVAVTPQLPAPTKHKVKPADAQAAPSAAPAPRVAAVSEADQVAEDAAATGMTSRAQPQTGADAPR